MVAQPFYLFDSFLAHVFLEGQIARHQGLGADHANLGAAQRGKRVNVRARHARMQHVADDRNGESAEIALVMANRVEVEQALGMEPLPEPPEEKKEEPYDPFFGNS